MVGQLLRDVVEASERPALNAASDRFDRFGFRIADLDEDATLEDKAERLRRQAEDDKDAAVQELENRDSRWDDHVTALKSGRFLTVTTDLKKLLRLGIPISQRVRAAGTHLPGSFL